MGNSNSIKTNPNGETMEAIVFEKYGNPELLKKSSIPKVKLFSTVAALLCIL